MSPDVKIIFLKISEQLSDPSHPLTMICQKFQELFMRDVDREVSMFVKIRESNELKFQNENLNFMDKLMNNDSYNI